MTNWPAPIHFTNAAADRLCICKLFHLKSPFVHWNGKQIHPLIPGLVATHRLVDKILQNIRVEVQETNTVLAMVGDKGPPSAHYNFVVLTRLRYGHWECS